MQITVNIGLHAAQDLVGAYCDEMNTFYGQGTSRPERLLTYATRPQVLSYVLFEENEPVGFATLDEDSDFDFAPSVLSEFYIAHEHRRRGLGTILAVSLLRAQDHAVQVSCLTNNHPARAFWTRVAKGAPAGATRVRKRLDGHDYYSWIMDWSSLQALS